MSKIFHPLLIMLAGCTEKELARQVQYLKEENQILRAKLPKRITVTSEERRSLMKSGKPLGKAIKDLITIVTPGTFARCARTLEPAAVRRHQQPVEIGIPPCGTWWAQTRPWSRTRTRWNAVEK